MDYYLCPDCRTEHTEPYEATASHIARCVGCSIILEMLAEENAYLVQLTDIRVAA